MLESLLLKLTPAAMPVPPVPSLKNMREPLQPSDYIEVPPVPLVPPEKTETKVKTEKNLIVDCYTPNGQLIKIEAKDAEHAAFLKRMNPKPKEF